MARMAQLLLKTPLDGSYNAMAVKSGSTEVVLVLWMKPRAQRNTSVSSVARTCTLLPRLPMGAFKKSIPLSNTDITRDSRKHTLYLPARESKPSPSSPAIASKKQVKRSKVGKAGQITAESISKGRRSTMNSRDAAYEEEQLRLAIEESKREGGSANTATATRKGKRGRSESVE